MGQKQLIPTPIDQSERLLIALQWLHENPAVQKLSEDERVYLRYRDRSEGIIQVTDERNFKMEINGFSYWFGEELDSIYAKAKNHLTKARISLKIEGWPAINKYMKPLTVTKINKFTHGTTIKITRVEKI